MGGNVQSAVTWDMCRRHMAPLWQGQAALWRCRVFHPTPQWASIRFGSWVCLLSPKWVARSLSLLVNFLKLPFKPLSRGAAPPDVLRGPHPILRGRQEVRGNYLFLFLPHHLSKYPGESVDGLASLLSGTAAAEFSTRLRAMAMA